MYAPLRVPIVGGASIWSSSSRKDKRYGRFLAHQRKAITVLEAEPRSARISINPQEIS